MFEVEADKFGDVYTIKEFGDCVKCGAFIPSDGFGCFGTKTNYSFDYQVWDSVEVPEGATHVHWFNK